MHKPPPDRGASAPGTAIPDQEPLVSTVRAISEAAPLGLES